MGIIEHILVRVQWRPGIGDPDVIGWVITTFYFLSAILCWYAGQGRSASRRQSGEPIKSKLWICLFIVMIFLGINKQLDLQKLLRDLGKILAEDGGWYHMRREVQSIFIRAMAGLGALFFVILCLYLKGSWRNYWMVALGGFLLIAFIAIRAASFHHVDYIFSRWRIIGPFRMKYVLELSGILCIGMGAALRLFRENQQAG